MCVFWGKSRVVNKSIVVIREMFTFLFHVQIFNNDCYFKEYKQVNKKKTV